MVDHIWAPVEQATLADFKMTFLDAAGKEISANSDFQEHSIRRNYRTMVSVICFDQARRYRRDRPNFYKTLDITVVTMAEELAAAFANGGSVTCRKTDGSKPAVVETGKTVEIDPERQGHHQHDLASLDTDPRYGNTPPTEVKGGATLNIKGDNGNIKAIGTRAQRRRLPHGRICLRRCEGEHLRR